MTKQNKNLIVLGCLVVAWAISWRVNRIPDAVVVAPKTKAVKQAAQETMLTMRFHRIRAEMDGLYHYRLKPLPFEPEGNPFRLPSFMTTEDSKPVVDDALPTPSRGAKAPVVDAAPVAAEPSESGATLLQHAIEATRIGGVVTMNDTSELNVNGELHKEGEVFTVRVKARLVLIRIKRLTTSFAIMALDDPEAGTAEMRVRLN
jgi:hypothetical protein